MTERRTNNGLETFAQQNSGCWDFLFFYRTIFWGWGCLTRSSSSTQRKYKARKALCSLLCVAPKMNLLLFGIRWKRIDTHIYGCTDDLKYRLPNLQRERETYANVFEDYSKSEMFIHIPQGDFHELFWIMKKLSLCFCFFSVLFLMTKNRT